MKSPRFLSALASAVGVVGAVALVAGCSGSSASADTFKFTGAQNAPAVIPPAQRKPAGDFSGTLLDGGTFNLKQDAGEVTVVNFWGTWCGPCTVETPQFQSVYQAYRAKHVAFVGIDVKESSKDAPKAFVQQNHITYPIVYDEEGQTAIRIGDIPTQAMPFTVVLDKRHRVAGVYIVRMAPGDLEPVLNKLLAET